MQRKFIVSGRGVKDPTLKTFQQKYRRYLKWGQIDSVFCFAVGRSPLYGGRKYLPENCLSQAQAERLNNDNIGIELTLSSHYYSDDLYRHTVPILEKMENKRNGVICTNDELAKRVRADFPQFKIKASSIKMIHTHEEIKNAYDIYDSVTLPPWIVDKGKDFLSNIEEKERIIIFLTCSCAYFCRQPYDLRCYKRISDFNISLKPVNRPPLPCRAKVGGYRKVPAAPIEFDINDPMFDGFTYFKLVQITHFQRYISVLDHPKFRYTDAQMEKLKKLPIINK